MLLFTLHMREHVGKQQKFGKTDKRREHNTCTVSLHTSSTGEFVSRSIKQIFCIETNVCDDLLFYLGRGDLLHDLPLQSTGCRVIRVGAIVRNISTEGDNVGVVVVGVSEGNGVVFSPHSS